MIGLVTQPSIFHNRLIVLVPLVIAVVLLGLVVLWRRAGEERWIAWVCSIFAGAVALLILVASIFGFYWPGIFPYLDRLFIALAVTIFLVLYWRRGRRP